MAPSKLHIRFVDLDAQQKRILPAVNKRIASVLSHGQYIMGPEVLELEAQMEAYLGVHHALTCSSGTDALLMVLMAMGIGPGDAVFTTPFTFVATAEVISLLGATPVFVDVDPNTFNLDPACLERAVKTLVDGGDYPLPEMKDQRLSPKCIIPVDLFGLPADYDRINKIAREYDLLVIADAAQSFGADFGSQKACKCAHAAATSFFPSKPLGCYGDGGAVFTNDDGLAEKITSIRVHGKGHEKYDNIRLGMNGRMDTIQAAVLLEKLEIFDEEVALRNRVAAMYQKSLAPAFKLQAIPGDRTSVWAQFSLIHDNREVLVNTLQGHKIPTAIYYPRPLHCQKVFSYLGYRPEDFPISVELSQNIFSLPMHPYLKEADIDFICNLIHKCLGTVNQL